MPLTNNYGGSTFSCHLVLWPEISSNLLPLSKTVQGLRFFSYFQTYKLACQFHGHSFKILYSWVRNTVQFFIHSSSSSQSIIFALVLWVPIPMGHCKEGQVTPIHIVRYITGKKLLSLKNDIFCNGQKICKNFAPEVSHYLCYSKKLTNLPFAL